MLRGDRAVVRCGKLSIQRANWSLEATESGSFVEVCSGRDQTLVAPRTLTRTPKALELRHYAGPAQMRLSLRAADCVWSTQALSCPLFRPAQTIRYRCTWPQVSTRRSRRSWVLGRDCTVLKLSHVALVERRSCPKAATSTKTSGVRVSHGHVVTRRSSKATSRCMPRNPRIARIDTERVPSQCTRARPQDDAPC